MIEIAMGICLTLMGIYFFKSTDLPKDLKERSAQMNSESNRTISAVPRKMTLPRIPPSDIDQTKLAELSLLKKAAELKNHSEAIDKLTFTITTLEQELTTNNSRNHEIQKLIDTNLVSLQLLQNKILSLS
jgi:hypothetical protein